LTAIKLADEQFVPVLGALRAMSHTPLSPNNVIKVLLDLERVLIPSQGRVICETLKSGYCFETLSRHFGRISYLNINFFLASFLSNPWRFVDYSYLQIHGFWNEQWPWWWMYLGQCVGQKTSWLVAVVSGSLKIMTFLSRAYLNS
jgi:hypothetical protein